MPSAARLNSLPVTSKGRLRLVTAVSIGATALAFLAGSYFARHYEAAATLMHPSSTPGLVAGAVSESGQAESRQAEWKSLVSDEQLAALNEQLHLYPGLIMRLAPRWTVARTRSNFAITSVPDAAAGVPDPSSESAHMGSGSERLRLTCSGSNQDTVLKLTNALAAALSQSRMQATFEHPLSSESAAGATSHSAAGPSPSIPSLSMQSIQTTPSRTGEPNHPASLNGLRQKLDNVGDRQAQLEAELRRQTSAYESVQQERSRLGTASKDQLAADRERQLNKWEAAEAALHSQLAAATQAMNDLGQRYTQDYPEYLNAKDRVDEMQARLNQFQSRPFVFVPEPPADTSKQLASLNEREAAIKESLHNLQQELDRNETDSRHVQKQVMHWAEADSAAAQAARTAPGPQTGALSIPPATTAQSDEVSLQFAPEFQILQPAVLVSASPGINFVILTVISLAFGVLAGGTAMLLLPQPPSLVMSEEDLFKQLPQGIQYLGGIPRIKHEIISR